MFLPFLFLRRERDWRIASPPGRYNVPHMKKCHIAIGGLLLPDQGGWEFSEHRGTIIGRRNDSPGLLEILHVSQDTLPQPVTHEFCLKVLRFMIKAEAEPTDRRMMESICGPYGAATFIRPRARARAGS